MLAPTWFTSPMRYLGEPKAGLTHFINRLDRFWHGYKLMFPTLFRMQVSQWYATGLLGITSGSDGVRTRVHSQQWEVASG